MLVNGRPVTSKGIVREGPSAVTSRSVTQQVPRQDGAWTETVEGEITRYQQAKTGSWFAHAKDDKLWLDRVEIRMADGEVTVCNLDQYSRIEILDGGKETTDK